MKKSRRLQLLGLGLILCGLLALLVNYWMGQRAQTENKQAVQQIQEILPPRTPGVTDH